MSKKMATETQKGRKNYVTHHCLIKFLVERSLQEASPMLSWKYFLKNERIQNLGPMFQPAISKMRGSTKSALGASSSKTHNEQLLSKEESSNPENVKITQTLVPSSPAKRHKKFYV